MAGQDIILAADLGAVLVAAPEGTTATVRVVVGRRGTEALLALVVASEQDLEEDGDQEEETASVSISHFISLGAGLMDCYSHSNDGDCEDDLL